MLELLQEEFIKNRKNPLDVFSHEDFKDPNFKRKYSEFRLGEIKDHLAFYYNEKDYDLFLQFFTFLNGKFEFSYNNFLKAYEHFIKFIDKNNYEKPVFVESADTFLQFLYETNVICYIEYTEDDTFIRWCFRERDYSNIAPKVKTEVVYRIHYGLSKALNIGKELKEKDNESKSRVKKSKKPHKDIYIENISYSTQENELHKLFSQFGKVIKVTIPKDSYTGKGRGFAFIKMEDNHCAKKAVNELNNTRFQNRIIKLNWSKK
jgi:hypothetical protein